MRRRLHGYRGERIVVTYDAKRCIHARECVRGLPEVFDPGRRPWVNPGAADADAVAAVIARCPTGALHFERRDGGPAEAPPGANVVTVAADGPLYLRGDLRLVSPAGEVVLSDTRLALCRCGASADKPFCDGRHEAAGFRDPGRPPPAAAPAAGAGAGPLRVTPSANGPLLLSGPFELRGADGGACFAGEEAALCRCGASADKPFCDGSHRRIGFTAP